MLLSCRDPYYGDLGSPSDKIEAISGSWILENVLQIDEKAPDKKQIDLSYLNHLIIRLSKKYYIPIVSKVIVKKYSGNFFTFNNHNQ